MTLGRGAGDIKLLKRAAAVIAPLEGLSLVGASLKWSSDAEDMYHGVDAKIIFADGAQRSVALRCRDIKYWGFAGVDYTLRCRTTNGTVTELRTLYAGRGESDYYVYGFMDGEDVADFAIFDFGELVKWVQGSHRFEETENVDGSTFVSVPIQQTAHCIRYLTPRYQKIAGIHPVYVTEQQWMNIGVGAEEAGIK